MQFLITAYDGTDPEASARRQAARPAHLEGANRLKEQGNLIAGGVLLNDDDEMIGSTLYVDFESREALDDWLLSDPYVTSGVWEDISIQRIRITVRA